MIDKYRFISRTLFTMMWIQLCWGFVCTDLVTALEPSRNYINLVADVIYVSLGLMTLHARRDVRVLAVFVVIVAISAYINHQNTFEVMNGFRDFIGLLFVPPILRYLLTSPDSDEFVDSMNRQLYVFLWIQVPCLVSQYVRFGACDAGGGSLGYGGSGMISTLIYLISFYLLNKRWDNNESYVHNLWVNKDLVFLLFPTFLNETKVSIVYFMLYFVLLMTVDRKFIVRMFVAAPVILCMLGGIAYLYLSANRENAERFDADFFYDYLVGLEIDDYIELAQLVQDEVVETDNLWVVDLPRFGRFLAVPDAMKSTKGGFVLGAGIGQFKGGNLVSASRFAQEYQWLLKGSLTMVFLIIIQLGFVGLAWLLWAVLSLILTPDDHQRRNNMLFYLIMVMAIVFVYDNQYRYVYYCVPVFYIYLRGLQGPWHKTKEVISGYVRY